MKKAIIGSLTAAVLVMAAPSFAQGPFADVPVDHWSYEAVSQLQEKGVVIGYPDGTFSGKRAMTRYEFALALSRAAPVIADMVKNVTDLSNYYTKADVYTKAEADAKFSTKAETDEKLAALNTAIMAKMDKAIEEFKSELAQMGVDIDALKRDVASLEERVAALEAEHKRLKITSKMTFFALGTSTDEGAFVDRDNRPVANTNNLLENVSVVRDADVIMSYEASGAKAKIVLNAGNYLNYLGNTVTNFTGIRRPDSSPDNTDTVSLFMAYGEVPLLGADVTVGRFPIQFTKWTLKKFDVDEYTENWKTDDGNYYVDGGKVAWNWGSVDLLAYAGKNNSNGNEFNYVSKPLGGPFFPNESFGIGAIRQPVQSAGVRATFGVAGAKVGLNYINSGATSGEFFDESQIWGVDVDYNIGSWKWTGAYTQSNSNLVSGADPQILDDNAAAWEVTANGAFGGLGINAAYVSIQAFFAAPGDWRRIGRWQNPRNIQGPELGLKYNLSESWALHATGAWYDSVDNFATRADDMKLQHYTFGSDKKLGKATSLSIENEWVRWDANTGTQKPKENYTTISLNQMLTENAKLRLMYQISDYNHDNAATNQPYSGSDYKGNIAVVQASMDF